MRTLTLLLALAAILTACGRAQPAGAPPAPTEAAATPMGDMPGMDHGAPTATAPAATEAAATPMGDMPGMNQGAGMATGAPYDAQFIDSMIVHHQGAIAMATQALTEAERPEIKTLAQAIVKAQEGEIAQLKAWRQAWYPDLAETGGMGMDMGTMAIATDTATPFDQRFIAAMIPHHEGAIAMARDAQQKAEHPEIKTLAQAIITAQEGEIAQMTQWRKDWFGK